MPNAGMYPGVNHDNGADYATQDRRTLDMPNTEYYDFGVRMTVSRKSDEEEW